MIPGSDRTEKLRIHSAGVIESGRERRTERERNIWMDGWMDGWMKREKRREEGEEIEVVRKPET
jgi:hypothetical protein